MGLQVVGFGALSGEDLDGWHALQAAGPPLDSPYFHPGWAAAVHASGREVQVYVDRDESGKPRWLLPVHREGSLVRPAGSPGADFQGPLVAPGTEFSPLALLTGGVRGFTFDHLRDGLADFDPWIESRQASPFLDVTGGLDGYLGRASRSGKDKMAEARRGAAKAERTHGSLRFTAESVDRDAFERLIALKREQYSSTGVRDFFAPPGRLDLVERLLRTREGSFGGMLSTVHAGPHLVAAHFGIRSGGVLHWWFPAYDPAFAQLSPGWVLLREVVMAAPRLGLTRIDLGRGEDDYKRRAKTGETVVCQGIVTRSRTRKALRRIRDSAVQSARSSALGPGLRRVVRTFRSIGADRGSA